MSNQESIIEQVRSLPTGWLVDAMSRLGVCGWTDGVRPVSPVRRSFAGRAVTVQYLPKRGTGPKAPNHYEVMRNIAQPGEVLAIAAGGTPCWLLGENQAHVGMYRGLAGICVDGGIRDHDEVAGLDVPVFARGAGTRPYSTHLELTAANVPVAFAGAQLRPGDIIVGDCDGLVVIPREREAEIVAAAQHVGVVEKEMELAIARQAPLEELAAISRRKKQG
ncbi:diguanylate cyclase [Pigmentiphaga soli]|uniref:Putative 4-hydroxy-4-methyl-2-oxoglutarate aldolase n=1 Tax=Pigmentiphaga soli TaxID=1007095 RepID=A0ABP8HS58_9BURK